MSTVSSDLTTHGGVSLGFPNQAALPEANPLVEGKVDQDVRAKVQNAFGTINFDSFPRTLDIATHLLQSIEWPVYPIVKPKSDKALPGSRERALWRMDIHNKQEQEVDEIYKSSLQFLEKTTATSIVQLKNKMVAIWHLGREIEAYNAFKKAEVVKTTVSVEDVSRTAFAKIGGFTLGEVKYDVVAYYALKSYRGRPIAKTHVGIIKNGTEPHFGLLSGLWIHTFEALIGREAQESSHCFPITEDHCNSGTIPVLNERSLQVNYLTYPDHTEDPHGSDRLLDQKLTQIMIEMSQQNQEIKEVNAESVYDYLPVLTAGGFNHYGSQRSMEEIQKFRSNPENKLFPPYHDYAAVLVHIPTEDVAKKVVYYSKGEPESWSDIIQREPILQKDAGILPEYFGAKPNIVAG